MVADRLTQWRKGVEMVEGILGRLHASLLAVMGDCNGEETVGALDCKRLKILPRAPVPCVHYFTALQLTALLARHQQKINTRAMTRDLADLCDPVFDLLRSISPKNNNLPRQYLQCSQLQCRGPVMYAHVHIQGAMPLNTERQYPLVGYV